MMDICIVDKERESLLAQPLQPKIQLVLELTMFHRNSFSRKTVPTLVSVFVAGLEVLLHV